MSLFTEPLTESYFYILLYLYQGPNHGYGIIQQAAALSGNQVKIGSGTMYGATGNLIKKGWIREIVSFDPADRRKRLYELTTEGRLILEEEIARLRRMLAAAEQIMNGGYHNEG